MYKRSSEYWEGRRDQRYINAVIHWQISLYASQHPVLSLTKVARALGLDINLVSAHWREKICAEEDLKRRGLIEGDPLNYDERLFSVYVKPPVPNGTLEPEEEDEWYGAGGGMYDPNEAPPEPVVPEEEPIEPIDPDTDFGEPETGNPWDEPSV